MIRGKWVLENILGTPPPPPPPNVPSLGEGQTARRQLTMREQMEQHRANPACAICHRADGPARALHSKTSTPSANGGLSMIDGVSAIDASGVLPDGTKFSGPVQLRKLLLGRPDQFVNTLIQKMLTYALGRGVEYYDAPAIRSIRRDAAPCDYRWSAIITGIVKSTPFQMRAAEAVRNSLLLTEDEPTMMIFKTAIPRRTFLRGLGTTLAFPLLDGMVPALRPAGRPRSRRPPLIRLHAQWTIMDHWTPAAEGAGFELTSDAGPACAIPRPHARDDRPHDEPARRCWAKTRATTGARAPRT